MTGKMAREAPRATRSTNHTRSTRVPWHTTRLILLLAVLPR